MFEIIYTIQNSKSDSSLSPHLFQEVFILTITKYSYMFEIIYTIQNSLSDSSLSPHLFQEVFISNIKYAYLTNEVFISN